MNNFIIILGLILTIRGVMKLAYYASMDELKQAKKVATTIIVIGCCVFIFGNSFKIIPTGHTGVSITLGQVDKRPMTSGLNWKIPFVQKVSVINNKLQNMKVVSNKEVIESTIKGKIPIKISDVTVAYYINPEKAINIYSTISDVDNLLTLNIVSSAIKATTPSFDTDSVVVRSGVESATLEELQNYVNSKYGENVLDIAQVTIGDISFTKDYNKSVEQKNKATQKAQTQEIVNKQNIDKAKADAEVTKTNAEAKAESKIIAAEATAKSNELVTESLNENILREKYIDKWDGVLPKVSSSDSSLLINSDSLLDGSVE